MGDLMKELGIPFPDPYAGEVDLLVISGEHSGDEHAARMVEDTLRKRPEMRVAAIGGRHLEAAGAQLLFDLVQFSVVGFVEVIRNLKELTAIRDEILRWTRRRQKQPHAVPPCPHQTYGRERLFQTC